METRQGGGTGGQQKRRVGGTAGWMELHGGWNTMRWGAPERGDSEEGGVLQGSGTARGMMQSRTDKA